MEAFEDASEYEYTVEPPAAVAVVPAATATWRADTLTQTAGQPVVAWAEADGKGNGGGTPWTFVTNIAQSILSGKNSFATPPVVAADMVNGHKLVSFNGTNDCLALTGASQTPVGYGDGLTVAAVVRFTGYGQGVTNSNHRSSGHFLSSENGVGGDATWALGLNSAARLTSGVAVKDMVFSNRSRRRFLNDGNLHVVVLSIPKKGAANQPLVLPGAYVKATSTNTLTMANVEFVGGGLAADFTSSGTIQPVTVSGNVVLPAGDVPVKVTAPDGMTPGGTLLSWSGRIAVRDTTRFVFEGPLANKLKVKVDEVNKQLRLLSATGSIMIIR